MALHSHQPKSRRCIACGHINAASVLVCQQCRKTLKNAEWVNAPATKPWRRSILGNFASEVAAAAGDKKRKTLEIRAASRKRNEDTLETQKIERDKDQAIPKEGTSVFDSTMLLYIDIDTDHPPLILRLPQKRALIIGRDDPQSNSRPDIDLIPYGGFHKGISRLHAALELSGKRLTLRDLKSSNGTYLNGSPLDPHEAHQLRDGDMIRLGEMDIKINFKG